MLEKLKEIIADQLNVDADSITAESRFKEDLEADSLDLFELVMALEEEYGVEIPSEDLEKILTVQDVIDYMKIYDILWLAAEPAFDCRVEILNAVFIFQYQFPHQLTESLVFRESLFTYAKAPFIKLGVRMISWTAPRRIQASCGIPSGSATRGTS